MRFFTVHGPLWPQLLVGEQQGSPSRRWRGNSGAHSPFPAEQRYRASQPGGGFLFFTKGNQMMHEYYSYEAAERRKPKNDICYEPQDDQPLTDHARLHIETAYRRGYYQGYHEATRDRKMATPQMADDFLFGALFDWRLEQHDGKFERPPELSE